MKRKEFLTKALMVGGAITIGSSCGRRIVSELSEDSQPEESSINTEYVEEPSRKIPILANADVVVIGGGPSGAAAAISASRAGADTYLVERYNHLGGLWTGGLVLPLLSTHAVSPNGATKQVIYGIGGEMSNRLRKLDMTIKIATADIQDKNCRLTKGKECVQCKTNCPYNAITINKIPIINKDICTGCGICSQACPETAIKINLR